MDVASIASAFVAAQAGRLQLAAAAKLLQANARASADAAKMIEAARQNLDCLAEAAAGIGRQLDISV